MSGTAGLVGDFGIGSVITEVAGIPLEEYGDTMRIEGIIVGDGHKRAALYLPGEGQLGNPRLTTELELTLPEVLAWLDQSDDPVAPIYRENTKIVKAVVRKAKRQVDQNVAWKVYEQAKYLCEYCGVGGVPLTYDHWLAQAFGGQTTLENGVSSCRPCNKAKGHLSKEEWVKIMLDRGYANVEQWAKRLEADQTKGR